MNCNIPRWCIENPISVISSAIRPPDQIIQPYEYGDPFQKSTCLWLKNLPLLRPTKIVDKGEFYVSPSGKKLPAWYSNNKNWRDRSRTFKGISNAFGDQWGDENRLPIPVEQLSLF